MDEFEVCLMFGYDSKLNGKISLFMMMDGEKFDEQHGIIIVETMNCFQSTSIQCFMIRDEKKLVKTIYCIKKGCTFAPAK